MKVDPQLREWFLVSELHMWYGIHCHSTAEKAMAPHSSTLTWKTPWQKSLVGCSPWGRKESDTTEWFHFHFSLSYIGEGTGNPLQCSCLESPSDSRAWWAAIYGVSQSWTQLKQLSSSSSYVDNDNLYLTYYTGSSEWHLNKYFLKKLYWNVRNTFF